VRVVAPIRVGQRDLLGDQAGSDGQICVEYPGDRQLAPQRFTDDLFEPASMTAEIGEFQIQHAAKRHEHECRDRGNEELASHSQKDSVSRPFLLRDTR